MDLPFKLCGVYFTGSRKQNKKKHTEHTYKMHKVMQIYKQAQMQAQ